MYKFELTRNVALEAIPFLVSYSEVLKSKINRLEKEISFFPELFREELSEQIEERRKELEDLQNLLKHYRDEF